MRFVIPAGVPLAARLPVQTTVNRDPALRSVQIVHTVVRREESRAVGDLLLLGLRGFSVQRFPRLGMAVAKCYVQIRRREVLF